MLRAVDRFALSIDCSARTIDLSFAHQSTDRATTDGSRNNQSIVQQVACAINRTHLNSNAPRSRLIAHLKPDSDCLSIVSKCIQCSESQITINVMNVQEQEDSYSCGDLAVAFATSLIRGEVPTQLHYKQLRNLLKAGLC